MGNVSPYKNGQMVADEALYRLKKWCTRLTSESSDCVGSCRPNTVRLPSLVAKFVLVINSNTDRVKRLSERLCSLKSRLASSSTVK